MCSINLNVVEGISKSLRNSVCFIDISIYPNNLFVNLASKPFLHASTIGNQNYAFEVTCPQQDPLKEVRHILDNKHLAYSIMYCGLHKRTIRVLRTPLPSPTLSQHIV
jgi:hypothetical protein